MKTYRVVSTCLDWRYEADSLEEAHAKAKRTAARILRERKGKNPSIETWIGDIYSEVSRVFRGDFVVEEKK